MADSNRNLDSTKVHFIMRNRNKVLMDEDIWSITSVNDKGVFDILPQHANFISLIQKFITVHKLDGTENTTNINNGVLKVRDNTINCYIDILPTKL